MAFTEKGQVDEAFLRQLNQCLSGLKTGDIENWTGWELEGARIKSEDWGESSIKLSLWAPTGTTPFTVLKIFYQPRPEGTSAFFRLDNYHKKYLDMHPIRIKYDTYSGEQRTDDFVNVCLESLELAPFPREWYINGKDQEKLNERNGVIVSADSLPDYEHVHHFGFGWSGGQISQISHVDKYGGAINFTTNRGGQVVADIQPDGTHFITKLNRAIRMPSTIQIKGAAFRDLRARLR